MDSINSSQATALRPSSCIPEEDEENSMEKSPSTEGLCLSSSNPSLHSNDSLSSTNQLKKTLSHTGLSTFNNSITKHLSLTPHKSDIITKMFSFMNPPPNDSLNTSKTSSDGAMEKPFPSMSATPLRSVNHTNPFVLNHSLHKSSFTPNPLIDQPLTSILKKARSYSVAGLSTSPMAPLSTDSIKSPNLPANFRSQPLLPSESSAFLNAYDLARYNLDYNKVLKLAEAYPNEDTIEYIGKSSPELYCDDSTFNYSIYSCIEFSLYSLRNRLQDFLSTLSIFLFS